MAVSRVHHCIEQIKVAEERTEPPARKCRCRKYVPIAKATAMVKNGEASFIVTNRVREPIEEVCSLCSGDKEVKNCANCFGTGKELGSIVREDYGNDIVLVSRPPADKKEKKRSSALAAKTPRVATIEMSHITKAYVLDIKEAAERIEEYGQLIQDVLQERGAEIRVRRDAALGPGPSKVVFPGNPEPVNDRRKGVGRDYDYGRAI